jgi:hypothetical protein
MSVVMTLFKAFEISCYGSSELCAVVVLHSSDSTCSICCGFFVQQVVQKIHIQIHC